MAYKHLNLEERHYIALQCKLGVPQNKIAQLLGRSQSSVSREINRNTGRAVTVISRHIVKQKNAIK